MIRFIAFAAVVLSATPALAQNAGPFSQGRMRVSALVGSGSFGGERSTILGANVGYFVLDGLQIGLEGDFWIGGNSLARVSPSVTYTVVAIPSFQPYAGVFYRHWFTDSIFEDIDTVGARGGVNWVTGSGNAYFGLGLAYETQINPECPEGADCGYFYPELTLALAF